ncbi:peptide/nickel transport system permease protein [Rhizobiales bacterium GAS188]|nr:peptide/nickel transport system permease protein [Rhizobiales bacterium GAS188]
MKLLRAALRSPAALVGLAIVMLFLFVSLFAPLIAPYDPLKTIVPLQLPGAAAPEGGHFWLGTDLLGRDILSRMIYGTRTVLLWSTIATASAFIIGVMAGLLAGYFQGVTDTAMSFLANALLSFPVMVLYIIIITSFGASGTNIVVAVSFGSAPAVFRITRALVMDVRERDYVAAAITQGEGHLAVMLREILPNVTTPLIADLCLRLGYTAITIGVLGFLGLGLPPPTPDWGSMAAEGKAMAIVFPHMVVFPCVAISLLMLGLSLLSDGLREAAKRVVPA